MGERVNIRANGRGHPFGQHSARSDLVQVIRLLEKGTSEIRFHRTSYFSSCPDAEGVQAC